MACRWRVQRRFVIRGGLHIGGMRVLGRLCPRPVDNRGGYRQAEEQQLGEDAQCASDIGERQREIKIIVSPGLSADHRRSPRAPRRTPARRTRRTTADRRAPTRLRINEPSAAGTAGPPRKPPATRPARSVGTPQYLTEQILTSRTALEGERKQITVLFSDIRGSTELISDLDPEDAQKLLDPAIHIMMGAVHRFEGTVNQVLGDGMCQA